MTKKMLAITAFLLLALAVGLYAMTGKASGGETAQPSRTATNTAAAVTCEVYTGIERGAVNLRSCAGTYCEVIRVLTEGERLAVLQAGLWNNVTTEDGVTGYINSNYCKGK
jgi:uncharacterized protein YgiM (DUF1202 family)